MPKNTRAAAIETSVMIFSASRSAFSARAAAVIAATLGDPAVRFVLISASLLASNASQRASARALYRLAPVARATTAKGVATPPSLSRYCRSSDSMLFSKVSEILPSAPGVRSRSTSVRPRVLALPVPASSSTTLLAYTSPNRGLFHSSWPRYFG